MAYKDKVVKVKGKNIGTIFLFTLSTCVWCKKTKALFKELGVEHSYVDVDLLDDGDNASAQKDIRKWGKQITFPTIIINNKQVIQGFDEEAIREACNAK